MFNIKKYNEINKFLKKTSNSAKIVAISKNHPVESILEAINCGVYIFGENRVQEAKNKFKLFRNVLPDHTYSRLPQISEIIDTLDKISNLSKFGPIYIHCFVGIERSPIICMAWLIREKSLNFNDALEYLRQVHPETNPLPEQLILLKDNIINLKNSKEKLANNIRKSE